MPDRPGHEHLAQALAGWLVDPARLDLRRVVLLVDLFDDESLEGLRRLADLLHSTAAGAVLEAALYLRHRGARPPGLIDRVLRHVPFARDETQADIYIAIGPTLAIQDFDFVIKQASGITSPKARDAAVVSLTELKDLRLHPIAPPDAEPAAALPDSRLIPDPADVRLVSVVRRQSAKAQHQLLQEVLIEARHHAHPVMGAAPPHPAEAAGEAVTAAAPPPEPEPAPVPRAAPSPPAPIDREMTRAAPPTFGRPTAALPRIGGALRSIGGAAVGAVLGVGSAIRNVILPGRDVSARGPTAAPTLDPDIFGGATAAPDTADAGAAGKTELKRPVVNTGLASADDPGGYLDPDVTLAAAKEHLFWLEIGQQIVGSIEVKPTGVAPELAKAEAELDVVLFDAGSKTIFGDARRGRLKLKPDGSAIVLEQPMQAPPAVDAKVLERRLLFPIRTPPVEATLRFRCNLYHGGVLIQSRLVRCAVREQAEGYEGALRSTLDYVLARSLSPDALVAAGRHEVSILTNQNDGATHGFYVAARGGTWARSAEFDADELQSLVERARAVLRFAAWGTKNLWDRKLPYRYEHGVSEDEFETDLINLGIRGFTLYDKTIDRLAAGAGQGGEKDADALSNVMRGPSNVQIATHADPRFLLPASMMYDRPLRIAGKHSVCETFLATLAAASKADGPIAQANVFLASECFKGNCPNDKKPFKVVCPSGLWGFRHSIGLPVSLESDEEWAKHNKKAWEPGDGDPPVAIDIAGPPQFGAAISTDETLKWPDHLDALKKLRKDLEWQVANTLDGTFELFKSLSAPVVYLYCHGGIADDLPFLSVGTPDDDENFLFGADLRTEDVLWKAPRPLVFINGCHTADVQPVIAHNLVSSFVQTSRASGVIGTEITIFVPLAQGFAQAFFTAFLAGQPVGDAIRTARLSLLAQSNPLGLAYTAYAMSSLHLTGLPN